jgi:hypothetical protein
MSRSTHRPSRHRAAVATAAEPLMPRRRRLIAGAAAAGLWGWIDSTLAQTMLDTAASAPDAAASAATAPVPADPGRLALVIGNKEYPSPFDLPPIHKNARDVESALQRRGFQVTLLLDAGPAQARQAVDDLGRRVRAAPPDATVVFYFSGHGVQVDAENLLVGAGVNPSAAPETLIAGSIVLSNDVIARLPQRPKGMTIAVVDACRTDLRASTKNNDGLNQVEAPPGCLIAFSTGAGKPAIAPAVATQNTFYTASLVKLLDTASDELTFSDLFRLVKLDVQRTMLNFPVPAIRRFAQFPFIAENTSAEVTLAPRHAANQAEAEAAARARFRSEREAADWQQLKGIVWPPDVIRLADQFIKDYPNSKLLGAVEVEREGAGEAAGILNRPDVQLYRDSFDLRSATDDAYRADLLKAARGDKDAAARIGRHWATKAVSGPQLSRYEGWMQYAAELGNGIASYELALHYRRLKQPQPAARWEARARELGYTPPPSLEQTRK